MHPAFVSPRDSLGAELPEPPASLPDKHAPTCSRALTERVGKRLCRDDLSDAELDQHIEDLTTLWNEATARSEAHHHPHDREDALLWKHTLDKASMERSRRRRLIDEGVGYFSSDAALSLGKAGGAARA